MHKTRCKKLHVLSAVPTGFCDKVEIPLASCRGIFVVVFVYLSLGLKSCESDYRAV